MVDFPTPKFGLPGQTTLPLPHPLGWGPANNQTPAVQHYQMYAGTVYLGVGRRGPQGCVGRAKYLRCVGADLIPRAELQRICCLLGSPLVRLRSRSRFPTVDWMLHALFGLGLRGVSLISASWKPTRGRRGATDNSLSKS